uniref:Variant surface glycoprotein 1125.1156 n=1 Tax=Trypanosoma brucei TaxID=5691 RepID=A0A1J0R6F1_9TRYP|nr:variant surface glycoprotein 1125.1156 [Trypanosoma brucei]
MKIQMLKKILVAISLALGAQCSKEKPTATMTKPSLSALTLSSVVDTLLSKTKGHSSTASALHQRLAAALAALTATPDSALGKAAGPVTVVLAKQLPMATASKLGQLERLTHAATKLANLTGHQFGIMDTAGLQVPDFTTARTDPGGANDNAANIYLKPSTTTYTLADHDTYNAAANKASEWATAEGFDDLVIYKLKTLTDKGTAPRKPVLGKGDGSNECKNNAVTGGTASNTHICVVGGELITAAPTTYSKANKNYGKENTGTFNTGNFEHYVSQALAAARDAIQETATISNNFDPDDISNYASDEDFKAAIGLQYLELDREKAIGTASEAVAGVIKATYGTGSEMKNKFWDKLKEINKPSKILGTDQTGDISSVTDLSTAVTLLLEVKVKENKQRQQQKTVNSKTEEKCKDQPQEECKDENGCEFKNGECKLKDSVKAENDGKNTNTTENNYIEINKAPPLLAVFVLG